jgi:dihydrofolate reductase
MTISLICATSQNGVIGLNNRLPWHLPADLAHFKKLTMGHHILMGRRTYQSIGRPLPGRTNVVITRQKDFQAEGCLMAHSVEQAIALCHKDDEIFVIGGAEIYQQTLPVADKIYLTIIHQDFEGDTFLFEIDKTVWQETSREDFAPDEKNKYRYSFITLEKV